MNSKTLSRIVGRVIQDVRKNGDRALIRAVRKFDKVDLTPRTLGVPKQRIQIAYRRLSPDKRRALEACARRITRFHWHERRNAPQSWTVSENGVRLGQIISPVDSVGLYVPGGRFSYPSTLLMTAIPAKLAGVRRRVVVTPPGRMTDEILAAAKIADIDEIYRVGGPASLAALAFGTKTLPKVDLIIGPGNAFVTEAKRQLYGEVGIDLLAGPSELVVVADETANPKFVAADMAAQAEHDPDSVSVLIGLSKPLIAKVRRIVPATFRRQCRYIFAASLLKAAQRAASLAGEHVQLMVRHPEKVLDSLKNGGAFFVDNWSPAVMGDYWAGPSHVLPTGRSARFGSGLSVMTFLKRSSLIDVSVGAFKKGYKDARILAEMEGLRRHAMALSVREKEI